jgi:hypothetical protein
VNLRLPVEVALTDQSHRSRVVDILGAEVRNKGNPTGFDASVEDDKLVVSFLTCVVQGVRP